MYYIGTSGCMYDSWKLKFYPHTLPGRDWLNFYSKKFATVEINNSFYRIPDKKTFEKWGNSVGENFKFCIKANRFITHFDKLKDTDNVTGNFINNSTGLKNKLSVILFQLPPFWRVNKDRLKNFLHKLPEEHKYAFEFRNTSWYVSEIFEILEKYNVALCIHDHADGPSPNFTTANFSYIRFHGPDGRYSQKYTNKQLKEQAKIIKNLKTKENYCFFNNDLSGYAIENALLLKKYIN